MAGRGSETGNDPLFARLSVQAPHHHRRWVRAGIIATCASYVLAFVSTPTFDPNGFARGLTVAEYRDLEEDIDRPLYDRALRGAYPPGSCAAS